MTYENAKEGGRRWMTKNASGGKASGEGRNFMYTSRSTGNRYTSHITNCYCTLARFYKAFKILFVIKFSSYPPTYHCHPLVSDSCRKFCARGGPSNFERSVDLRHPLPPSSLEIHWKVSSDFLLEISRTHGFPIKISTVPPRYFRKTRVTRQGNLAT